MAGHRGSGLGVVVITHHGCLLRRGQDIDRLLE
jgi:hypothetical protein